jgi:hypothetical protein
MKKRRNGFVIAVILITVAISSRLLPHWHNFTAVGATGLFGAYYFRKQIWSYVIPIAAMWISDLLLNNWIYTAYMDGFVWFNETMLYVYVGFIAIVVIGQLIISKMTSSRILIASIAASVVFFLFSNFSSFLANPIFPKSGDGLLMAYAAGIPFFWNTLLSNILYTVFIFGVFHLVASRNVSFKLT